MGAGPISERFKYRVTLPDKRVCTHSDFYHAFALWCIYQDDAVMEIIEKRGSEVVATVELPRARETIEPGYDKPASPKSEYGYYEYFDTHHRCPICKRRYYSVQEGSVEVLNTGLKLSYRLYSCLHCNHGSIGQ